MFELIDRVGVKNRLGEGIIWDSFRQCSWWTDIQSKLLFKYQPSIKKLDCWDTPERLCSLALISHRGVPSDYMLAAFDKGIALYNPLINDLKWVYYIEEYQAGVRLNDGRTDRQGRFWVGEMNESQSSMKYSEATDGGERQGCKLYCVDRDLNITTHLGNISISNGLCWSPEGHVMYHCDTPKQIIDKYSFESSTGEIRSRSVFRIVAEGNFPDGATIDSEGCMWSAKWGGGQVVRYSPRGEIVDVLKLNVPQPTCVAFGGDDLRFLFVTTAREGLCQDGGEKYSNSGDMYIFRTNAHGLLDTPFQLALNKLS